MSVPDSAALTCPLCETVAAAPWGHLSQAAELYRCPSCKADFARWHDSPATAGAAPDHFEKIDPELYLKSVGATRQRSYQRWLRRVRGQAPAGNWLDVGCSFGWLLKFLEGTEFDGFGVEPSPGAAQQARAAGLRVKEGLFPAIAGGGEPYSVVSFFDVLEHFSDPVAALSSARQLLKPQGVLAIQVPDQSCLLYRLAEGLHRVSGQRVSFALRRLWLAGFDFPHRVYFNATALRRLLSRCGFEVLELVREPIGNPWEAVSRVSYAHAEARVSNFVQGLAVGGINACDSLTGYGGLLCVVARATDSAPMQR